MNRQFVKVLGSNFQTEGGGEKSSRLGPPTWLSESGYMCVDPQSCRRPRREIPGRRLLRDLVGTPCISLRGEGADGIARDAQLSPHSLVRRW